MRTFAIMLTLIGTAAVAQDAEEEPGPLSGMGRLFEDLFSDVEPHLRELRDSIGQLGEYEAPEMLPNGDIIIRRKTPLDPESDPDVEEELPAEDGEPIDL